MALNTNCYLESDANYNDACFPQAKTVLGVLQTESHLILATACTVFLLLFSLEKETEAQRAKQAPDPSDGKCQGLDSNPSSRILEPPTLSYGLTS